MKVSDIYGTQQTGVPNSNMQANPQASTPGKEKQAQAAATGSKMNYGTLTLLLMFGALIGAKYGLEKKGS